MFNKIGSVFTISEANRIKTADTWNSFIASQEKKSIAEGVTVHRRKNPSNEDNVVCNIDLDRYIYIHTTIMASVDVEDNGFYITRDTEKYINNNGDAWPRESLLKDYHTFIDYGSIYVEHDQNPERAKGKVLDAIARDMGDTILIDLLFCVDRIHKDLVNNIETGIANAVSMGCSTKYTICDICGHKAHDENEYCDHVKNRKNQMIRCEDGVYRKAAELCYNNTFFDCSIVANPAFAGAIFRKLVAFDKVSSTLLSNMLTRRINTLEYENEVMKIASMGMKKQSAHPIEHEKETDYPVDDPNADIPYRDRHNILEKFDEQQPKDQKVINIGKKASAERGKLVVLTAKYNIPSEKRKTNILFNFVAKNTVGRVVGKANDKYAVYFAKIGMVTDIPSSIVNEYSVENEMKDAERRSCKIASNDDLVRDRKGMFKPTGERFQILDIADDELEVRWLDGEKTGQKEKMSKNEFKSKKVKWASINVSELATFSGQWNGKHYQLKTANWNEKYANLLNNVENHIDNIQDDIMCVMPSSKGKYAKSFVVNSKFDNTNLQFIATVDGDNLNLQVDSTDW